MYIMVLCNPPNSPDFTDFRAVRPTVDDLAAATAAPLVLTILCDGDSCGFPIVRRIRECSEGQFEWTDGVTYPLLQRLWRLGYVTAEWRTLVEGHTRRYYSITDGGRAALEKIRSQAMSDIFETERDTAQRCSRATFKVLPGRHVFPRALQPVGALR